VALGLVLLGYGTVFREVNGMFNAFAHFIAENTTGGTDIFEVWLSDLQAFHREHGFERWMDLFMGGIAAVIGIVPIFLSYILYPLTYVAFIFLYGFYGAVLYVVGPLVIALIPAFGVGSLGRSYLVNLMVFNFWGVIYAVLGALMTAVNLATVRDVLAAESFGGGFVGMGDALLLGIASIFYSISIAGIPFLASRIVRGETFGTIAHVIVSKLPLPLPSRR
jgi:hypothetical protein